MKRLGAAITLLCLLVPVSASAESKEGFDDEFSFEVEEFEKKALEWGGFAELKWEHQDINQSGALAGINLERDKGSLDRIRTSLQLDGSYTREIFSMNWQLKGYVQGDDLGGDNDATAYQAYATLKPSSLISASLGKKTYKWGKGYAWNPAGFINRPKDPNDPEEAMEGFITGEVDLVKSFSGPLRTAALTTVVLPVSSEINDDFGEQDHVNLAAKLYLLYRDVDIDFMAFTGNSRTTRFGADFSTNLASNFEIHGEGAYIPELRKGILKEDGTVEQRTRTATSWLLGFRYLTERDLTTIVEYYGNDGGLSHEEMVRFYDLADLGQSGNSPALSKAEQLVTKGYGRAQPGRRYLYLRMTQKEPFDILYLTPGVTCIGNLEDGSFSLAPELSYTGFENWEMRVRFSWLEGGKDTEYGEKMNRNKLECRVRYFF
ncbi:MAG TPA: hypothetical protein VJ934_11065 [Desulfomicrobiaceae bacterium]|nr:hypothetical protein [Desulfomicrobiaceae bacterium]